MTTIPLITTIPTDPPSTADPATFDTRADAFLGDLPDFTTELNATATAMNTVAGEVNTEAADIAAAALAAADAAGYVGVSTSTIAVSAGAKSVALTSAKDLFAATDRVYLVNRADPSIRLVGTITTKTSSTQYTVTVTSGGVFGSGSYSSWLMIHAGFFSAAATALEIWAASTDAAAMTPKGMKDALNRTVLTDAATVTPDGATGIDFYWEIGGNRTLGAITNTYPGARGTITIKQDGTGGRELAVASAWKRRGGLGVLSTAAAAEDEVPYEVKTVDGSNTATRIVYDVIKAPS